MLISASVRLLGEKQPSARGWEQCLPKRGLHPVTGIHERALQLRSDVSGGGERCGGASSLHILPRQERNKGRVLTAWVGFRVRHFGFTPATYLLYALRKVIFPLRALASSFGK